MIERVLDYIDDYENIRALTGLDIYELQDTTIELLVYKSALFSAMNSIQNGEGTLFEQFEILDDPIKILVKDFACHVVAERVLTTVGLTAIKTKTDGKSSTTRFSPESAYLATLKEVRIRLTGLRDQVYAALGIAPGTTIAMLRTSPGTDRVTEI